MTAPLRVLVVEDSESDAKLVIRELRRASRPVEFARVEDAAALRSALAGAPWDVVVSDWSLPAFSALDALRVVKQSGLDLPFIVVTGTIGEDIAVEAMRSGVDDYLLKDRLARLAPAIERELRERDERRAAEHAQREAELRFRRLSESGVIGITVSTETGAIVEANDAFLDMVGRSRAELAAGLSWLDLTPVERPTHLATMVGRLRVHGHVRPWETEYLHRDGRRVPALVGLAALDGARAIAFTLDLTERKRSEARKVSIVDTALDAIVGMDHAGTITEFNPAAEAAFGRSRGEVIGRSLAETIIPARLRDAHARGVARILASDATAPLRRRLEVTAARADGTEFPAEVSITRVANEVPPSFIGFVRDITERTAAEASLRERVKIAALTADVGIALTTAPVLRDALQRCAAAIVRHLDAAFARIWTLDPRHEVLELQATAGLPTPLDDLHRRVAVGELAIGMIASERRSHVTNAVLDDPELGDPAWARREGMVAFAGHPLVVGGELVGVIAMFARAPVTEAVGAGLAAIADAIAVAIQQRALAATNASLEEQLRQSQKLEAIGSLAGGIAHDFNNLLTVILSYGELLSEDVARTDPMAESIDQIVLAARRAADLTRQLLAFGRRQVLAPRVLDPNDSLSRMQRLLGRLLGETIELTLALADDAGCVTVDPGQFEQVIMNLAVNARDAMPTGGKLTLETGNVEFTEATARDHVGVKPGSYVMVAITDTGIGMDRATQARIFEPFFTTKPTGQGTGLGLSTAFGIVRQSEGQIWVASTPGQGSTFTLYLPRTDLAGDPLPAVAPNRPLRGTETILVVEDEDSVRVLARTILRRLGYRVLDASNAGDALLICEQQPGPIDLMITDIVMPRMSGRQLADRLRALRSDMKVLYISGYTDHAIVNHGVLEPGLAFLQKPLTPESLARKVREVLDP